jgi:hypothetical protein
MPLQPHAKIRDGRVEIVGQLPILQDVQSPMPPPTPTSARDKATHSPDFTSVNWFGTQYAFSPTQRAIVAVLWRAWVDGYEWVHQDTLLENADSMCGRLQSVFKGHPAWRTMIVSSDAFPGQPLGAYKLNAPT